MVIVAVCRGKSGIGVRYNYRVAVKNNYMIKTNYLIKTNYTIKKIACLFAVVVFAVVVCFAQIFTSASKVKAKATSEATVYTSAEKEVSVRKKSEVKAVTGENGAMAYTSANGVKAKTTENKGTVYTGTTEVKTNVAENEETAYTEISEGITYASANEVKAVTAENEEKERVVINIEAGEETFCFDEPFCTVYGEGMFDVQKIVDYVAKKTYVKPKNAEFYIEGGKIKIASEKDGKKIDEEKLFNDVTSCVSAGGGWVSAKFFTVKPDYEVKDLVGNDKLRAEFSTFVSGSLERLYNVWLATECVSEVTVYPNEIFSFNDVVGKRTEERGYKNAKVIVGGKFVDGVGGGVCQVSTTLYNAALLSGLEISEQHRHTLAVSYVEKSFDAMVSYGYADLKIKNTTGAPIFIAGNLNGRKLEFTVYGKIQTRKIERQSVVSKIYEPMVTTVESESLKQGESKILVAPKKGYESQGYLIITENGEKTKVFLRCDEYKKVDGVIEVGK